jgi:hypothetical protein
MRVEKKRLLDQVREQTSVTQEEAVSSSGSKPRSRARTIVAGLRGDGTLVDSC